MISAMLALAALSGNAEPAAPPPAPVVEVNWTRAPSSADFIDAYPARAWDRGASGRATLSCFADHAGRLRRCSVVSEEPNGLGFGAAALRLSSKFRVAAASGNRGVVGGHIRFAINFQMPRTQ